MLPKIENKLPSKQELLYPKTKINSSNKQNHIARLKKLRQFLQNKSIHADDKPSIKSINQTMISSVINYGPEECLSLLNIVSQDSDRTKANTSQVQRKRKKESPYLEFPTRWSIQRKQYKIVQKIKLKEIVEFSLNKKDQKYQKNFTKCKIL